MMAFILSTVGTGLTLAGAFYFPSLHALVFIALIPLLRYACAPRISLRRAFMAGWLCGAIGYGLTFSYVTIPLHILIFLMGLAYYASYTALFAAGVCFCGQQSPEKGFLIAPALWSALEYLRANALTGVQVGSLASTQIAWPELIQCVSITGVFGLSFLIVLINTALTRLLFFRSSRLYGTVWSVGALATLTGVLGYGHITLERVAPAGDVLTLAAVQGDIDERSEGRERIFDRYRRRTLALVPFRPDLIVYPETMTGSELAQDTSFQTFIADIGEQTGRVFMIGSRHLTRDENRYALYNSVFMVDAKGRIRDRYDKRRLVPFGEYTPLGVRFPVLTRWRVTKAERTRGAIRPPMRLPDGVPVGVEICYEAMYGSDTRRQVDRGARLLVIVSDDFWYRDSIASRQFYDEAVLRAVENRIPVIRCANMGVSGVIDATGRTVSTSVTDGVVQATVTLRTQTTPFTRRGDYFPLICCVVSVLFPAWIFLTRRQKANPRNTP